MGGSWSISWYLMVSWFRCYLDIQHLPTFPKLVSLCVSTLAGSSGRWDRTPRTCHHPHLPLTPRLPVWRTEVQSQVENRHQFCGQTLAAFHEGQLYLHKTLKSKAIHREIMVNNFSLCQSESPVNPNVAEKTFIFDIVVGILNLPLKYVPILLRFFDKRTVLIMLCP